MEHGTNSTDGTPALRAPRFAPWRIGVSALAMLAALQSITITLPINGRVVDKASGEPIPNAAVAALWQLEVWTPVHGQPGPTIRIAQALTNEDGAFEFPMTVLFHPPVLPLSWLMRSDDRMPELIVAANGYCPDKLNNDTLGIFGPAHGSGFWFVRASSLQQAHARLLALPEGIAAQNADQCDIAWAKFKVAEAQGTCARRWYCKHDSLADLERAFVSSANAR
jgi:hypothetical protein